jgi:hypothetical protein
MPGRAELFPAAIGAARGGGRARSRAAAVAGAALGRARHRAAPGCVGSRGRPAGARPGYAPQEFGWDGPSDGYDPYDSGGWDSG